MRGTRENPPHLGVTPAPPHPSSLCRYARQLLSWFPVHMIHHGSFLRHKDTESGSRIVRLGQIRHFWAVYSTIFNILSESFRNFAIKDGEITPSRQKKKQVSLFCSRLFVILQHELRRTVETPDKTI